MGPVKGRGQRPEWAVKRRRQRSKWTYTSSNLPGSPSNEITTLESSIQESDLIVYWCDEDFTKFFQLTREAAQFHLTRIFMVGSSVEVDCTAGSVGKFCNADLVDLDMMIYKRDLYIINSADTIPTQYRGQIYRYATDGLHPCYAHLLRDDGIRRLSIYDINPEVIGAKFRATAHERIRVSLALHGPAYERHSRDVYKQIHQSTPDELSQIHMKHDFVFSFHSPYWPLEATEWINRHRPIGSSSVDVIKHVVSYGSDLVCAPHKGYIEQDKRDEWRFSFSMAELMLIKGWTTQQRAMYRAIRVLHKLTLSRIGCEFSLCTYYYKTLMLWSVDTKPRCFWKTSALSDSLHELLENMICGLINKSLPHYFVPSNNLLDHLTSENLSAEIKLLLELYKASDLLYRVLHFCITEELCVSKREYFIAVPKFIYYSLQLLSQILNIQDNFIKLFRRRRTENFYLFGDKTLRIVYNIFSTITNVCKRPITCRSCTDLICRPILDYGPVSNNSEASLPDGNDCILFYSNSDLHKLVCLLYRISGTMTYGQWLDYCRSDQAPVMSDVIVQRRTARLRIKRLVYNRVTSTVLKSYVPLTSRSVSSIRTSNFSLANLKMAAFWVSYFDTDIAAYRCHRYTAGYSPTVPVTWFINKAYTANHYYTLLCDHRNTVKICDEIINVYHQSDWNSRFGEQLLPVLLSTQWMETYDKELQKMLGLAALCRFMTHVSDNQPVHIPICPVLFAYYLKCRCMMDAPGLNRSKLETTIDSLYQHDTVCSGGDDFLYGAATLKCAMLTYLGTCKL